MLVEGFKLIIGRCRRYELLNELRGEWDYEIKGNKKPPQWAARLVMIIILRLWRLVVVLLLTRGLSRTPLQAFCRPLVNHRPGHR